MRKLLFIGVVLLVLILPALSLRLAGDALFASKNGAPRGAAAAAGRESGGPVGTAACTPEWDSYKEDVWRENFGFAPAASPTELRSRTGLSAVSLPTETLGRNVARMLYRAPEGDDPVGDIVVLYSDAMRLSTAYSPPDRPAMTAEIAKSAGGTLAEIEGVPVLVREPALRTDLSASNPRKEPGVVVWIWRGKEWRLYGLDVSVADLTRVATSVIVQQLKAG